jgi:hypothetical protein
MVATDIVAVALGPEVIVEDVIVEDVIDEARQVPREPPEVIDGIEDHNASEVSREDNWKLNIGWKVKVAVLVLFVIATVTTFSLVFSRKDKATTSQDGSTAIQDEPTGPPTTAAPAPPTTIQAEPTAPPTMSPTAPPSESPSAFPSQSRIVVLEDIIAPYSSDVTNDGAPQRLALEWLADEDPLQLALNTEDTYPLLTRYALTVLYLTTTRSGWESNNWKSGATTCEWDGVTCDGYISDLILGKSNGAVISPRM